MYNFLYFFMKFKLIFFVVYRYDNSIYRQLINMYTINHFGSIKLFFFIFYMRERERLI